MMNIIRKWMLAANLICGLIALSACSSDDNPAVKPGGDEQQLADYTIMWYGHGGGNLDMSLMGNIMDFYFADEESYKNVNICAQYKFSSLENMQELYKQYVEMLGMYVEPGTPEYDEALSELDAFKMYYPYAAKTARFVVDREEAFLSTDEETKGEPNTAAFFGPDNADITCADSLTNFINWAASVKPAKNYILVVSDHGGSYMPHDDASADAPRGTRGVMYDDGNASRHFTVKSLAGAISAAKVRPACVYLDACLMNTVEYLFELAPTTDYIVSSTFVVPGEGGKYSALIDALSQNPDNLEKALTIFTKATVGGWDENAEENEDKEPVYHDMTVTRTADLDAFGAEMKKFTDKLITAYQSGDADVKAKIDGCTASAYKVNAQSPSYDVIDYLAGLCQRLPEVFGSPFDHPMGKAFDRALVYQQSSKWLEENQHTVDCSVMLGCQGHYILVYDYGIATIPQFFNADGTTEVVVNDTRITSKPWNSTLDQTYGQLRFDQITGWSRWLKLNEQEPNQKCYSGYSPILADVPDEVKTD